MNDHQNINTELLKTVGEDIPEEAQLIFEGEHKPVAPRGRNKKRIVLTGFVISVLIVLAVVSAIRSKSPTPPPADVGSDAIELAIAAANQSSPASAVNKIPPVPAPDTSGFAVQTIGGGENIPLPPTESVAPVVAKSAQPIIAPAPQPQPQLILSKPAASEPSQEAPTKIARPAKRAAQPVEQNIIVARNKQVQSVPMRNLGVVAILTDGLIMKKGEEDIEVSLGEVLPGLGVLQKTNPRERTIETDQRIYKLN